MDKFWSIAAMPLGLTICFGPAFVVWWFTERKQRHSEPAKPDQSSSPRK
jgi:hypothetical protein